MPQQYSQHLTQQQLTQQQQQQSTQPSFMGGSNFCLRLDDHSTTSSLVKPTTTSFSHVGQTGRPSSVSVTPPNFHMQNREGMDSLPASGVTLSSQQQQQQQHGVREDQNREPVTRIPSVQRSGRSGQVADNRCQSSHNNTTTTNNSNNNNVNQFRSPFGGRNRDNRTNQFCNIESRRQDADVHRRAQSCYPRNTRESRSRPDPASGNANRRERRSFETTTDVPVRNLYGKEYDMTDR